jgi:hypothetical protein
MADVVDDFGRVTRLAADFESLSESLRSAVGKAVEYASGRAKENADDLKEEFDKLVDAMEELGEDVKDSLKSTKDFVEEVKKAAESVEKARASKPGGGRDTLADAQREQTRILQQILAAQQKAVSEKAAKFTTGGTALSSPTTRRPELKEMGFRPRGADKIPAMVSPGEFVVSKRGAMGNEGLLDKINRGYMRGGKVKPQYLAGGSAGTWEGRRYTITDPDDFGRRRIVIEGHLDEETKKRLKEDFAHLGGEISVEFSEKFDKELRRRLSKWAGSMATALTGGGDPFQVMFEGVVKDITEFRREMRSLAFQTEGITGEFRNAQAEFSKIGENIAGRTGKFVTAFQKAYMNNARKGFKDQKAGMKVLESGLKLSTLIGSETQATATLFADWHRELGMGAVQMERMANNMQMVARSTGVTGDELLEVMKSSDQILKNLRDQGTLTTTAARNITQAAAEFKKQGFESEGQKILGAMSSYSAFRDADKDTRRVLTVAADAGNVDYEDLMFGNVPQDRELMGNMAEGLKKKMADAVGVDVDKFDLKELSKPQLDTLAITMKSLGTSIGAADAAIRSLESASRGVGGQLSDLEKITKSTTATSEEKKLAEKKMSDALVASTMDVMGSIREATEHYSGMDLSELSKQLSPDKDTHFSRGFEQSTKNLSEMAPYLSDSLKRSFGLSGSVEEMAEKIKSMDIEKQVMLGGLAGAEQMDKAMKAAGKENMNFSARMKKAMDRGDMGLADSIGKEMAAAQSELQVEDASAVDPIRQLEQTMNKFNENIRNYFSPLTAGILSLTGSMGLLAIQFGMMGTSLFNVFDGEFVQWMTKGGLGKSIFNSPFGAFFRGFRRERKQGGGMSDALGRGVRGSIRSSESMKKILAPFLRGFDSAKAGGASGGAALLRGFSMQFRAFMWGPMGKIFQKALGPAVVLLGGIKGAMEARSAGRTKTEGAILGALTGGAKTGSFLTGKYGDDAGMVDKTLGVAGAAGWGAMAGAAIGTSLAPFTAGLSIPGAAIVGALIGGLMEIVKIITEGTDILADLFAPFQAIGNWLSGILGDLWRILKSFATLNPVTIITEVIGGIVGIISKTVYAFFAVIFGAIRMFVIGLPRLILRAFEMLWELPRMFMESIKNALAGLVDNEWVGPIFKTLSDAFNAIYDGFMAIWTPISEIFSGLGTVFSDLGQALFGSSAGGSLLSGIMWGLQKGVYALAYVISWLLYPVKLLAQALGFVLTIIGKVIGGIVGFFQYLYKILVGSSIVPDLVFGIIKFFAMLPIRIFKFLATVPYLIGKALLKVPEAIGNAFSNIGSYLQGFGTDGVFGTILSQLGVFYSFIGDTLGNLVGMASGILEVIRGIFTLDFGVIWEGITSFGSSLLAQAKNFGSFLWKLLGNSVSFFIKMVKKIPILFLRGLKAVFYDFPSWLMGKLMDGVWAVGNFLVLTLPKIMWQAFKNSLAAVGKFVWDTLSWPFKKAKEFMEWAWDSIKRKVSEAYELIKSMFDIKAWGAWFAGLGTYVYEGFRSALQDVWDWIKSWIPGLGGATKGFGETAEQQEATRLAEGDKMSHAIGGLAGAVGSLAQGNFSEAGGKAWSATKEGASAMWEGTKYAASYLNPFSYFKEGTKKIEKPGLGMLHEGEMVVPKNIVEKIAAVGSGAFGSLSSFVMGKKNEEGSREGGLVSSVMSLFKGGGGEESGSVLSSLSDRIRGMGDVFKGCCPGEAVEGAEAALKDIPDAVAEALGETDTDSFFGRINKRFKDVGLKADKFFKPMTTGFIRARKRGDGFFTSITRGLKAQYMSATQGGEGEGGVLSRGMDWINKSIFGQQEGRDTKRGIFQRIKDGIFGSKEGEDTKKGILDIIKGGLFGDGEDVKKGLFQIAQEGLFGKEGEGGGVFGWFKSKVFGNKVGEGQEGPSKPGLADAAKNTANSLWNSFKKRIEYNAEDGVIGGAKKAAMGMYGKAKEMVFGQKMAEGEMGPARPGLLTRAKSKATNLYGKARDRVLGQKMEGGEMGPARPGLLTRAKSKLKGLYGKAKGRIFGPPQEKAAEAAGNALDSAGKADSRVSGSMEGFKEKLKNIAEGIKEFSGTKVLAGAINLIPSSVGLVAMIPGSGGARMIQGIDGEKSKASLQGLANGIKEFSGTKVLAGAINLIPSSIGLVAMIPGSLGARMLQGVDGKKLESSLKGLGKGVATLGNAKVLLGAAAMVAVGIGSLGLIPAVPIFALLGVVGPLVEAGLKALGKGLSAFGKAAANPYTWLGVLLLAALNVALIPLAYALSLLSPLVEAFGKAIKSAFEGMGELIKSAAEGIVSIMKEITPGRALGLFVAAGGIAALGVAMAAFAAGKFVASWIDFFSGDGLMDKILLLGSMGESLMMAGVGVEKLGKSFKNFAANKSGGWAEWFAGSDGVIEGFKELSKIGTPEFVSTAEAIHKMGDGMDKIQNIHSIPMVHTMPGDATTATTPVGASPASSPSAGVEPVHLRDITGTILRDRAGATGNRLQSDELSRMEEASNRQVSELEQIRQGIQELVSLMKPSGGVVGGSGEMGTGNTKDPRRPMHAARFGKMKFGIPGGLANRSVVNTGET